MNAGISYLTDQQSLDSRPPMLVAAATPEAQRRAMVALDDAGLRGAAITIDSALDRLARQASASGLWIELDPDDIGDPLDRLLAYANNEARAGRLPTIVSAPAALIDAVSAWLDADDTTLLVAPDALDRATALALASASYRAPMMLHDVAREPAARRLKQLSDEVGRIAATLARLSTGPDVPSLKAVEPADTSDTVVPLVAAETVRNVIRARRLRARFFDEELFADPAWDMLLDLLAAEVAQHRVPVSSLCIAAAVPATTALRWIKMMTDSGLFVRRADPHDGRRVFIELAPNASLAMRRYFAAAGAEAAA